MRLLVVAEDRADANGLADLLTRAGYRDIAACTDVDDLARICTEEDPALVLLSYDAIEPIRVALGPIRATVEDASMRPVIVVTSERNPEFRRRILMSGVRDFVAKPVEETELLLRVRNALQMRSLTALHRDSAPTFNPAAASWDREIDSTRESLSVLAAIADYHDDDTAQHAERVGIVAAHIAEALELPASFVALIRVAAPLHDIGKVGISRRILVKPGKLTPAEWEHMMRHVEIGAQILGRARSPVLRLAADIAGTHHERWDGSGYLAGLQGEDIPLGGRITALADVWDTLTHDRPYKAAWDEDRALAEIIGQSGAHFDPRVVDAFLTLDRAALSLDGPSDRISAAA